MKEVMHECPTCMPHILDPDICAGCKEEPLDWDEEVTYHIGGDRYTHKEHGEGLKLQGTHCLKTSLSSPIIVDKEWLELPTTRRPEITSYTLSENLAVISNNSL